MKQNLSKGVNVYQLSQLGICLWDRKCAIIFFQIEKIALTYHGIILLKREFIVAT